MTLRFAVVGLPVSQGSVTPVPRPHGGVWIKQNPKLAPWRKSIARQAKLALCRQVEKKAQNWAKYSGPVGIEVTFGLRTPQRPKHPQHLTKPDLDKLGRAVLDALSGVLYRDDSQVIYLTLRKIYVLKPGARLAVVLDPTFSA